MITSHDQKPDPRVADEDPGHSAGDLSLEVSQVRGLADTEIYAVYRSAGPVGYGTIETLAARLGQDYGARLLRAVIFGEMAGSPPPGDDRWIWVRPTPHQGMTGTSVELLAVAPRRDTAVSVSQIAPGATLVSHMSEGGLLTRRLVQCVPTPAGGDTYQQLTSALAEVESALRSSGMTPLDIDRTWFFVADIGRAYSALNAARDAAFDRWGVQVYPSSTGIGAVLPAGAAVSLMVEASSVTPAGDRQGRAETGRKSLAVLNTPLQAAPSDYGPRFVRGNSLRLVGRHTVNVSGISSIDARGRSILSPDPADCIDYAVRSLLDVLGVGGAGVADIRSAYVYCKGDSVREAFAAYLGDRDLRFPYLLTYAPVCRSDLVFEIEARAVRCEVPADGSR